MICPHCKKPVPRGFPPEAMKLAKKLRNLGWSFRDIEKTLWEEGFTVSFATISRRFRNTKKK